MLMQILIGSLTAGAVYALVALGFVLIYKGTGVVHFGYGEQLTFGAYMALIGQSLLGLPFGLALLFALAASALLGWLIFGLFAGPLRHATLWTRIIATLAIGIALREGLRAYMGPTAWPFPFLLSQQAFEVGGIYLVPANLAIAGIAVLILAALFLFLERTLRGKAILAACENRTGASLVGIRVSRVYLTIWILASLLAAVAGILIAPQLTLSPDMGIIAIKGFTAAVIGGFASLPGAVLGGLLLGVLEGLAGAYVSSAMKDVISYAVLILVMLLMPHGLFGKLIVKKV
ncbi:MULTISPECIES: branched-chain amino acid ABC transporter permease [Bordetella]|uniref:Branched-chain amino acid ABC transporter permease n=3 Tax=Bordetella TaxID=517 RepID=A0ABX4F9E6_9BORD|nr:MULTISPECIES: branched-chain amino acid ABC transporter permease [Bordetella]SHR18635.1 ABC-type branched-chain amino acid transport system, permease protein I [Mycobacteroides abscessus subsp. abscessus]AOB25734.1 branched-chain amino acid ABC transporter permease [Bordetella bronchiseptica]AWP73981.1 branched-chain amino acid ABC transporter permease [Bordetella bronchiseptica]AZW20792.1 branched-chain amino acid ABC transporter permease [Bordetella bronchiseptica]AZW42996.1 branched-chai